MYVHVYTINSYRIEMSNDTGTKFIGTHPGICHLYFCTISDESWEHAWEEVQGDTVSDESWEHAWEEVQGDTVSDESWEHAWEEMQGDTISDESWEHAWEQG